MKNLKTRAYKEMKAY